MASSSTSSSSSSSSSPPWANLPADLLELLLGFQNSFFDQLRFGAVCKSWRDAAAAAFKGNPARRSAGPSLPVLTFRDPTTEGGRRGDGEAAAAAAPITRCFYSLSDDKIYRLQVPHESRDWHCWGSSHGWLAMLDLCAKPFLFNPISGERVDLPSLATLTRFLERREEDGATVYISHYPFDEEPFEEEEEVPEPYNGEEIQNYFVHRLMLSSSPLDSNCIAMAIISENKLLAFARPGDDSWVEVWTPLRYFQDIIYHDHRFYALACSCEIITIDFESSGSPTVDMFTPRQHYYYGVERSMYLVALPPGEIILLVKHVDCPENDEPRETEAFDIYKLEDGSKGKEWVEVDCIGDCCLFLGFNHSMSLSAAEVLGKYRANCIYFTDDNVRCYRQKDYGGLDFGVFDIEEEEIGRFCHMDVRKLMPPPMWIMPTI